MQNNSGIKGNTNSYSIRRELDRELKREEPQSKVGDGDITASIVKSEPFNRGAEKRIAGERMGGPQVGMGKSRIAHDSRTDGLISNKNEKLNHHRDRCDDMGGITPDTDMRKGRQGNTLAQPSDGKNKFNRDNQVMNPDESQR